MLELQMLTDVEHRIARFIGRMVRTNALLEGVHMRAPRHRTFVAIVFQIHKSGWVLIPRREDLGQQPDRRRSKDAIRPHYLRAPAGGAVSVSLLLKTIISDEAAAT